LKSIGKFETSGHGGGGIHTKAINSFSQNALIKSPPNTNIATNYNQKEYYLKAVKHT
jgi:hypothetical protein